MNKSTSKALYAVSSALFTVIGIIGLAVVIYSVFINKSFLSMSSQTLYVVMAAAGPIGLASSLRHLTDRTEALRKISISLHSLPVFYCAAWILFLYFISEEHGDMASQAIIWLLLAACIKSLISTVKAYRP